jgi:hypothetical protein
MTTERARIRELEALLKAYEERWVQQDLEIISQMATIAHLRADLVKKFELLLSGGHKTLG